MADVLNKWNAELESHTKEFHKLATQIIQWDLMLLDNGYNIQALYEEAAGAEALQHEIDSHLDYVDTQQNELSRILDTYEKSINDLLSGVEFKDSFRTTPADEERERAFNLSETLNNQLNTISDQLNTMVGEINAARYGKDTDSTVQKIVKTINNHYQVIKGLREDAQSLEGKIKDAAYLTEKSSEQVDRMSK